MKKTAPPPPKMGGKKSFSIRSWTGEGEGEKIILYGITGSGKTTLASMAPDPVFIGADDGGRKIRHPTTKKPLKIVPNIKNFQDVRDVLHSDVFSSTKTIVVDTITIVEQWGLAHTLENIPKPKSQGGGKAKNVHDYGYHEGFRHWQDTMVLLLPDFDRWIQKGKNIILIAQATTHKWKTSGPEDFLMEGPSLYHSRTASTLMPYLEWADHIFRISYSGTVIDKGRINPVKGRQIDIHPDATFFSESRTIPIEYDIVEFKSPSDDGIWRLLFNANSTQK